MQPQNQLIYQHFQKTVNDMKQRQTALLSDIATVKEQLVSMERELENLEKSILSHQGGMSTIELLTNSNMALIENPGEQPLTLNQFPVTQQAAQQMGIPPVQQQQPAQIQPPPPPQMAPAPPNLGQQQQQYAQQPTQQAIAAPQPPITLQAQQAFAPQQYPSPGDIAAAQAIQGPQIVQGPPPSGTE